MKFRTILSLAVASGSVLLTDAVCLAEEGGSVNPLALSKDIAFWTAVVFIITLLVLGKFAWKPIVEGLDKREQGIADQIAQAEKMNQDAQLTLAEYKSQLADAKAEVAAMIEQARQSAEKSRQLILEKAKADAEAESKRAKTEIELAKKEAMQQLADNAADLALVLAGKICQKDLDKSAHAKLINEAVENFQKQAL
ncbi:MAG: F0F1 ATP synthase subunit B [Thermoguttaceae bacterium]|nr:F0F1 ATP synthase subunit B [Thermoguttaceae bacterium]